MLNNIKSEGTRHSPKTDAERNARDQQLIEQIRNKAPGWEAAFDTLIESHRRFVFQRCLMHLRNYHDAQDVAQEVTLCIYRGLVTFEGRASFRSWLHSIVDNLCRSYATRRATRVMTEHVKVLIQVFEQGRAQREEPVDKSSQVAEVLAQMPTHARDILQLRFFQDLSLEDIARALGIGLSAAKMRLYRALEQFKHLYGAGELPAARLTAA
jgi:RNA polymerase sigma-70 factor (ECF subfamily)